jgi:hypothetical protein
VAASTFARCATCGVDVPIRRETAFKAKCTAGGAVVEGNDEVAEKSEGASDVDVEPIATEESSLDPSDVEQLDIAPISPSDKAATSPTRGSNRLLMTIARPHDQGRPPNPQRGSVARSKTHPMERRVVVRQQ